MATIKQPFKLKSVGKTRFNPLVKISAKVNFDNSIQDMKKILENLDRIAPEKLELWASLFRQTLVQNFDATSVYRKPGRKTGSIRYALNQHQVNQDAKGFSIFIGDKDFLPFYWKFQEYGTKPYVFEERYIPIFEHNTTRKFRLISVKNDYFRRNIDVEPIILRIQHPGIRRRGFISRTFDTVYKSIPQITNSIVQEILEK